MYRRKERFSFLCLFFIFFSVHFELQFIVIACARASLVSREHLVVRVYAHRCDEWRVKSARVLVFAERSGRACDKTSVIFINRRPNKLVYTYVIVFYTFKCSMFHTPSVSQSTHVDYNNNNNHYIVFNIIIIIKSCVYTSYTPSSAVGMMTVDTWAKNNERGFFVNPTHLVDNWLKIIGEKKNVIIFHSYGTGNATIYYLLLGKRNAWGINVYYKRLLYILRWNWHGKVLQVRARQRWNV